MIGVLEIPEKINLNQFFSKKSRVSRGRRAQSGGSHCCRETARPGVEARVWMERMSDTAGSELGDRNTFQSMPLLPQPSLFCD